jgi:serine protease AprX
MAATPDDEVLRHFIVHTFGRTRRTQDSPVLPEVWLRYATLAAEVADGARTLEDARADLLLTPWSGSPPGRVAQMLRKALGARVADARIGLSTSRVVAAIDFTTLVQDVVPLTGWWKNLRPEQRSAERYDRWLANLADRSMGDAVSRAGPNIEFFRYASLVGFIYQLMHAKGEEKLKHLNELATRLAPENGAIRPIEVKVTDEDVRVLRDGYAAAIGGRTSRRRAKASTAKMVGGAAENETSIFVITLNREASQSLVESRKTVKADAAQRVFDLDSKGIAFAVIDGGIDATHPACLDCSSKDAESYLRKKNLIAKADLATRSRVVATYDLTLVRDIIASSGRADLASERVRPIIQNIKDPHTRECLQWMADEAGPARELDWEIVMPLVRVPHDGGYHSPGTDHGTHVAGILAANWKKDTDIGSPIVGMCPSLSLYDLRVFDETGKGDEFGILCALELVGWLNRDRANPVVHGVNLSLALAHDVASFGCGQTPICEVCNYLVGTGTVVVAAAGNSGFDGSARKQSLGTGYRAISITDPGNADHVITVGSTHRRDPHAYGVSYFSARGPTGDGRRKPDLLAPGEKIISTIRNGQSQRMDGTSMAAPHVSGAAALLMARYPELIGNPLRIKEILMRTATDLARESSFQGAGLLDVLRALQSV